MKEYLLSKLQPGKCYVADDGIWLFLEVYGLVTVFVFIRVV